jgi:YD repeat-containing protein
MRQFLVLLAATLVRAGTDLLLVTELLGHARLETTRGATWLTAADPVKTLGFLPGDRRPPAAHPTTAPFTRILAVPLRRQLRPDQPHRRAGNTTAYCYDVDYSGAPISGSAGNFTRVIAPAPAAGGDVLVTLTKYDAKNNVLETVSPKGVASGTSATCATNFTGSVNTLYATDNAYDGSGVDLLSTTRRYTDPDSGQQTATTKYEYNDANNPGLVTRIIPPRGDTGGSPDYSYATTMTYYGSGSQAGMLQSSTDADGNKTTYGYDAVGRKTSMVDPDGNAAGGTPSAHTWAWSYDNEDRPLTVSAPAPATGGAALTTQYQYDPVGNRTVVIDADGQVTKDAYDARNSLVEVDQSPNAWTDPNATPCPKYVTA